MRQFHVSALAGILCLAPANAVACSDHPVADGPVILWPGLSPYRRSPVSANPKAQRFFDQGLIFAYSFNHGEAERSFRQAHKLDPQCALCLWGSALAAGPNINNPMKDEKIPGALADLQAAEKLLRPEQILERDLLAALKLRYQGRSAKDALSFDKKYADAMKVLSEKYPSDVDVRTLYAEALMDLSPWNFWTREGQPKNEILKVLSELEQVLKTSPRHPGANHFYIHALEGSAQPEKALGACKVLLEDFQQAAHMLHMPSHIYLKLGRYREAIDANQRAIAADDTYFTKVPVQGVYGLLYRLHNHQFLNFSYSMAGDYKNAVRSAKKIQSMAFPIFKEFPAWAAFVAQTPLRVSVRFGKWKEILAEPAPKDMGPLATGYWHYARVLALAETGDLSGAEIEVNSLKKLLEDPKVRAYSFEGQMTQGECKLPCQLLSISYQIGKASLEEKRGQVAAALASLSEGIRFEDGLEVVEFSIWSQPVRQIMGDVYLKSGDLKKAAEQFQQDLKVNPQNPWSLWGLSQIHSQYKAPFLQAWLGKPNAIRSSRF